MTAFLESWIVPAALLVAFAAVLLAPLIEAAFDAFHRERVPCPVAGGTMTVELRERWVLGEARPVDVLSCSAFADPAAVTCGKKCLSSRRPARG